MKTLIVVFFLLFVSSILAAPADWEGTYVWTGFGIKTAFNCYEDGWIFGTAGYILGWGAKVNAAGDKAYGQWWSTGYKFGGPRIGQSKNLPNTGQVRVTYNAPGNLTVEIQFRGRDFWVKVPVGAREDVNVTDRIPSCGIMNPSSNDTLAGEWREIDSDTNFTSSDEKAYFCMTNNSKNFEGSYSYKDEDDDKVKGYQLGKCSWGGMVCRSDWYEYPTFGCQLDRLLIDGTKGTLWWDGPIQYENGTETNHGWFSSNKTDTADDDDCSDHEDELVWPFKCHTFDSKKDCEANSYYCKVSRTNEDDCRKIKYKPS
jgi:hypothetical protein